MRASVALAWSLIWADKRLLLTGLVQSFFEGAMYIFVFLWTPSLTFKEEALPPYVQHYEQYYEQQQQ
jgi:hypothetical protein